MSVDKKTIEAVVSVLPIAVDLVGKLIGLAQAAKNEGYDVPSIPELEEINSRLRDLEDL